MDIAIIAIRIFGIKIIIEIKKVIPPKKSIQLGKSFSNPKEALTSKIIPKTKSILWEIFEEMLKIKTNPAIKSIPPNILTNMFFKLNTPLKIMRS